MSDSKVQYKRKRPRAAAREAAKSVAPVVQTLPDTNNLAPVEVKRGPKPDVVKNFASDPRSAKLKNYIQDGLSAREAGIMAGFAPEQLDDLQKRSDSYRRFVQKAMIEFKQHHLGVIKEKADPKTSQWLLEKMFPEEFALKGKDAIGNGNDRSSTTIINAIFKSVQSTPDDVVPVKVYEQDNNEAKQDDGPSQNDRGAEPSLNAGGANII